MDYQRPELSKEQMEQCARVVATVTAPNVPMRSVRLIVAQLVGENMRLLAECNEHRAERGIELLPVVDNGGKK